MKKYLKRINMHVSGGKRIKRKLFNILKSTISMRSNLGPVGIYSPEDAAKKFEATGGLYKHIYRDCSTELCLTKDFFSKVSSFTIFDNHEIVGNDVILRHKGDYEVLRIPNGRLYTNNIDYISIITEDNKLVDRLSYQYKEDDKPKATDNKIFRQKYFIKPKYIDGTVFSTLSGFGATHNIGHWFLDSIPRIHLLKKSGLFEEVDFFIVPAFNLDYHKDSLKLLGVEENKILIGTEDTHFIAKNLIVSSHPRGERSYLLPQWVSQFLRQEYISKTTKDKSSPKRIFVSRKDSRLRQVVNESDVTSFLNTYGFQTVLLSQFSLLEKVKLFNNAEVIISPGGAGLISLFFCEKNTSVVEIFPEGFVDTIFYNIARNVGMKHFPLICKSERPSTNWVEGQLEDLHVDLDELKNILIRILN